MLIKFFQGAATRPGPPEEVVKAREDLKQSTDRIKPARGQWAETRANLEGMTAAIRRAEREGNRDG